MQAVSIRTSGMFARIGEDSGVTRSIMAFGGAGRLLGDSGWSFCCVGNARKNKAMTLQKSNDNKANTRQKQKQRLRSVIFNTPALSV